VACWMALKNETATSNSQSVVDNRQHIVEGVYLNYQTGMQAVENRSITKEFSQKSMHN
jgi:hypothetical protein